MTKTVTTGKATDLITFTRSTTGTYLDSVKYGDELVTNGDFSNGTTGWSSASDGVGNVVDGQLVITSSNPSDTAYAMSQSFTVVQGESYKVSANLVSTTGDSIQCRAGSTNTSASYGTLTSTNTLGNVSMIVVPTTNTMWITLYCFGAGDSGTFDNISVKKVIGNQGTSGEPLLRTADTNEPRIEYDLDGNLKGLLIEEQRTNLVTQSENLTTWSKTEGGAVVANQAIAPDGTKTADEVVGVVYKTPNIGSSTRAFSVYLKAKAGTTAQVRIDVPASNRITVDLTDGSVTFSNGSSLDSYGVVDVGNGWYRCHIVVTDSINNYVIVGQANNASHTLYAWGAQLEEGSFPTSYIPTSGSTVTRNADVASINVSEFEYNTNEGSLFVEASLFNTTGSTTTFDINDGTANNRILVNNRRQGTSGSSGAVIASGVIQTSSFINLSGANPSKAILAYANSDFASSANGSDATTDTSGSVPSVVTTAKIGNNPQNQYVSGHIKSIKYYPVRLTNDQLKALTQ